MDSTVSFAKNAANVFFHILTRCNLKCRHCYINPAQHGKNTLSYKTIEKWLTTVTAFISAGKDINVVFLGGEPSLHPDLSRCIKKARALGYRSITVDTNGYLFNDILAKVTPQDVDYFSFSLDGATEEMNDRIRGTGSYKQCLTGISQAVYNGFKTSLIYTVSRDNIAELVKMPHLLKELGIDRFFIQVIGIRGKAADPAQQKMQIGRDEWLCIVPAAARAAAALGITATYPKVYLSPEEPFECAGQVADNYFIFPNGRVYRCPLCEDFPVHSLAFVNDRLTPTDKINECDLFQLDIPEGCVMNKIIQPDNLSYNTDGSPAYKIACCLLKEEIQKL
ncbi:MAG: radical SAM protein [Desulfobacterales bacterium]|nr:radical SAM protein [Desulfobacterales bacterium]